MSNTNGCCLRQCGAQNCGTQEWWDQEQSQGQSQFQAQGQDQDQNLRTIVKDIGNNTVNINVDFENILVAVLLLVEVLLGEDPEVNALRIYLEQRASQNAQNA